MSSSRRSYAVLCGLILSFALLIPGTSVLAAGEEMVITGSRIPQGDKESINPITVLSDEDFKVSGNVTIENFMQELPQVFGGDYGSTVNNGNPGFATASMRGLGPNRTLVLINGKRPAPAGTNGFVDLNMIPAAMVDRIEVVRDGASTIYGSDAIAGVLNILTKDDFDGVEFTAQWGQTTESDGDELNLAMTIGGSSDRGNFVITAQYTERDEIRQGDRGFSECPFGEETVAGVITKNCIGSGTTYPAHIFPDVDDALDYIVDPTTGVVRPFTSSDTFNYATSSYMVTPQDVYSVYGFGNFNIVEEGSSFTSVNTNLTVNFANRQSEQLMAPEGTFWAPQISQTHPDNPFGDILCAGNPDCTVPQDVFIARRLRETAGRGFTQDVSSFQIIPGLDGVFSNDWTWDLSYSYARYVDSQRDTDRGNRPRIDLMLDPAGCAADGDCTAATTASGGPAYWNPFARDTLTPEMQAYALVSPNELQKSELKVLEFNLVGDIPALELGGGPVGWSLGYQNRQEDSTVLPDAASLLGQVFNVAGETTVGGYEVDEVYGEIRAPILQGAPFAEVLTVTASARWSDYDFLSSSDTNWKFGAEWAPINAVRLRATVSEGFRAPNIDELFSPVQQTAANYNDPCNNYGASLSPGNVVYDNCFSEGLPTNFSITSSQAFGNIGGNSDLTPETSDNWTIGVVIAPESIPTLVITLDWFDIQIDNAIGTVGTDNIITGCYNSVGFSSPLCDLIEGPGAVDESPHSSSPYRNALGNISGQNLQNANLGTFETSGLDFSVAYGLDSGIGLWNFSLSGTYLDTYDFQAFPGGPVLDMAGKFGIDPYQGDSSATFPELQWNLGVGLSQDNWGVNYKIRYMDETEDLNADAGNLVNTADDVYYHDIQGYYEWNGATITLGVINLTDEDPPYVTNYDDMNTIHFSYDTVGTRYYLRASKKF
ncbi:MAG: TonB-dependent receptor [Gammaproteobacteria bacterium]|nr:TonB-dependent receptor [Gammaproteobacteria bacterium]